MTTTSTILRFLAESSADSPGGRVLADIAAAHEASPRQVALAFLTRAPSVLAIPKAARAAHALDNAGALALELGTNEIERIDAAFPRGPKPRWRLSAWACSVVDPP